MDAEVDAVEETDPSGEHASPRRQLGQRMRELRRDAGWTQEDLACGTGLTKRTIGSYERDGIPPNRVGLIDEVFGGELLGRPKPAASPRSYDLSPAAAGVAAALEPLAELLDQLCIRLEALEKTAGGTR